MLSRANIPEIPSASAVFLSPERKAGQSETTSKSRGSLYLTDVLGSTRAVVDEAGTIVETRDYYPFGLTMPGRSYSAGAETLEKFSGKELDENTGQYYFGARYLDPALGRFFVPDRFADKYPSMTPYQYAANNPVNFIDVNGDSLWITHRTGFLGLGGKETLLYEDGTLYNKDGSEYDGKVNGFLKRAVNGLDDIREGGKSGDKLVGALQSSESNIIVSRGSRNEAGGSPRGFSVKWNPRDGRGGIDVNGNSERPSFIGLAHELGHAYDALDFTMDQRPWVKFSNGDVARNTEITATHIENTIRAENGIPLRAYYGTDLGKPKGMILIPGTNMSANIFIPGTLIPQIYK